MADHNLDPEGLVKFTAGEEIYTLFFGMRARKEIERYFDKPFFLAIQTAMPQMKPEDMGDKAKIAAASATVNLTNLAKLFEFGLLRYHDLTEEEVDDIIDLIGLGRASELLAEGISASMEVEAVRDGTQNPPKPAGKPRAKKTGTRSLPAG